MAAAPGLTIDDPDDRPAFPLANQLRLADGIDHFQRSSTNDRHPLRSLQRPPGHGLRVHRASAIGERLRSSLWFIPALFALGAGVLAVGLITLDDRIARDGTSTFFMFGGSPEGARSVLSAIAQSMLTFTGLVFTITMLVLQLASTQLSPRVVRTFLRDRTNQAVLGLFVATFVFTLLVLREVRSGAEGTPFVPAISIWVAFAMLIASVGAFIYYINHMAHAIRASTVIENIWRETRGLVDRCYPERLGDRLTVEARPDVAARETWTEPDRAESASEAGVVTTIDVETLLAEATAVDGRRVEIVRAAGDFVPEGAPVALLWGPWDDEAAARAADSVAIDRERTLEQDVMFGIRQLVDVALRALSPGTNDPTTAVQALDRLHDLLRSIVARAIPEREHRDAGGVVRVVLPAPDWDAHVALALDEIRLAGAHQLQVHRRMRGILRDLLDIAPPPRQAPLRDRLQRLERGLESFDVAADREFAATPRARHDGERPEVQPRAAAGRISGARRATPPSSG